MSQKLQETECTRCGQPTTTTRGLTTQHWDLTPISGTQAMWVALFRSPILAVAQSGTSWRAQVDRNRINIPTTRDTHETWLPGHRCHHPPIPGEQPPISLTPPTTEFDLFNQPDPTDDLPPY